MPCYKPIEAWRSREENASGKRGLVFKEKYGVPLTKMKIPCGRCIGCRLEYSRQWAMRLVHESSLHASNSFITLTYNDENLPDNSSLDKTHFQQFMKRLRERLSRISPDVNIRYFHSGEYGERFGRPHYHAIIFGYDFPDKVPGDITDNGDQLYESPLLNEIWGKGNCMIGDVTFESCAYVARYVIKKVKGDSAKEHYTRVDPDTGELFEIQPEYSTMSRRPGIGKAWIEQYYTDAYPSDFLVMRGQKMKPPKYYDDFISKHWPIEQFEQLKLNRRRYAQLTPEEQTRERLDVKEKVKIAQTQSLKGKLE